MGSNSSNATANRSFQVVEAENGERSKGWSIYGAHQAQQVGKEGSTVRVRQRASRFRLLRAWLRSPGRRTPLSEDKQRSPSLPKRTNRMGLLSDGQTAEQESSRGRDERTAHSYDDISAATNANGADVRRGHAGRPVAALDERAQVANEPRLLPRRQRLVHGLLQRRRERIRGEVPKGVPVARLGRRVWLYFQLERELDVGEARRFDPGEEVALVPADERFGAVAAANLLRHVPYVPNVVAGEDPVRFGPPETVDRLEHRESPATTQHSEELAQCGFLVVEIDHHGTRRDGVDGGALQRQLVRRRAHELAARIIVGDRAADVQDVLRDVAEDYAIVLADQPERTEPDQPFA